MYIKILFVFILLVLSGFFFVHYQNPGDYTFVLTKNYSYTLPVTLFVFMGFVAGVVLAVLNSLIVDVKKAVRDAKSRRRTRRAAETDADYHKGVDALVKGHTAEARGLLEKAVKTKPNDTGLIISLADTYMKEGNHAGAVRVLEAGITNNPGAVGILMAIGDAARAAGDTAKAARAFSEAVEKDPKSLRSLRALRAIRVGESGWDEAAEIQKSITALVGDSVAKEAEKGLLRGYLLEGAAKEAGQSNYQEALARLNAIIKGGAFLPAEILKGDVLKLEGSRSEAVKVWEQALKSNPNSAPLLLRLEDSYLEDSAPEKILERYKAALAAHPDDVNLKTLQARLYLRLEMVDNAIDELERLHNDGQETDFTRVLLGEAYLRRNQAEQASDLFKKALGAGKEMAPPFACTECRQGATVWTPRCRSCGRWDTMRMKAQGA